MANIQVLNKVPVMPQDYINLKAAADANKALLSPTDMMTFPIIVSVSKNSTDETNSHYTSFYYRNGSIPDISVKKKLRFLILGNVGNGKQAIPVPENGDLTNLPTNSYLFTDHVLKLTSVYFWKAADNDVTGRLEYDATENPGEDKHPIFACNTGSPTLIIDLERLNGNNPVKPGTMFKLDGGQRIEIGAFRTNVSRGDRGTYPDLTDQTQYVNMMHWIYIKEIHIFSTGIRFYYEWESSTDNDCSLVSQWKSGSSQTITRCTHGDAYGINGTLNVALI